ncbi:MAG: hypothetical protein MHPDNHAH_01975 [Anaerolineales bacterium]|nr:hypothetical protein [Anaerolineales bacterium]
MLPSYIPMPLKYRMIDSLGSTLEKFGAPLTRMDSETLHRLASRETGLSDFGDPYYREGLDVLVQSLAKDANLHFFGRYGTRMVMLTYLSQRLLFAEAQKRTPEIFQSEITAPFVIVGLPRSGTTILHRMLSADPENAGIPMWRLYRPFPMLGKKDDRQEMTRWELQFRRPVFPEMDSKHVIREDKEEECIWMMGLTFHSICFWVVAPVSSYAEWLFAQDQKDYYREYSLLLKVQQQAEPEKRLVLKAPDHTPNLGALLSVIPHARVIYLHRDPVTCLTSANSMFYSAHRATTHDINPRRMAEINRKMYSHYLTGGQKARSDPTVNQAVLDIQYESLVNDPMQTVKEIYSHFGVPWTVEYEERLKVFLNQHPKDKHGAHQYAPEQFGQTAEELSAYFAKISDKALDG